ncbi:Dedicator of cytokinesis protein 6 [Balamuthia mandrillaris]
MQSGKTSLASSSAAASSTAAHNNKLEVTGKFFERLYRAPVVQSDQLKEVILFPQNDVCIKKEPRVQRTEGSSIPKEVVAELRAASQTGEGVEPHILDSMTVFTRPWKQLQYKEREQHGVGKTYLPSKTMDWPKLEFELTCKPEPPTAVQLKEDLLAINAAVIKQDTKDRQKDRARLFNLFQLSSTDLQDSDTRAPGSLPSEPLGRQITVECKELRFALGEREPFFCSFTLYHKEKRERISDTFHFDLNSEKMLSMVPNRTKVVDATTKARKIIFFVTDPSPEIYLVLRVEKVLTGDPDAACDPYFKHATIKPKAVTTFTKELEVQCERLGAWTQPFAWGAHPLFSEDGALRAATEPTFQNLIRIKGSDITDESIFDKLPFFISDKERKKMKNFPVKCVVEVKELDPSAQIEGRYSPSRIPVLPKASSGAELIKEAQEFWSPGSHLYPFLSYVHNLYVYLDSLNFQHVKAQSRNIAVAVRLLQDDENISASGLQAIYGKSSGAEFVDQLFSTVNYHNKKPTFYDEIKIRLPASLSPKLHLVFAFYHIGCQLPKKKKEKNKSPETLLAYAVLPLIQDGRLIDDGEHVLNAALELPAHYLSALNNPDMKWVDKKPVFSVQTRLTSSIHTQDDFLHNFFHRYRKGTETSATLEAIRGLRHVSLNQIARFSPVIIDALFQVMCVRSNAAGAEAFLSLLHIINSVSQLPTEGYPQQHPQLVTYVSYHLDNVRGSERFIYHQVCKLWIEHVASPAAPEGEDDLSSRFSWFLLSSMIKSMALKIQDSGEIDNDETRPARFDVVYLDDLKILVGYLMKKVQHGCVQNNLVQARDLNIYLAYFMKDLFSVADRGFTFDLIYQYISQLNPTGMTTLTTFKFTFLKIVIDHEHYIPLNLPLPDKIDKIDGLVQRLWQKHFMVGCVINEVMASLQEPDKQNRMTGIQTLRNLLVKHEFDPRYQDPAVIERIAGIYFPFILLMVDGERKHILEGKDNDEKRNLLLCFLHILKNMSRYLLNQWWTQESQAHIRYFFTLLTEALKVFEYDPLAKAKEDALQLALAKQKELEKANKEKFDKKAKSSKKLLGRRSKRDSSSNSGTFTPPAQVQTSTLHRPAIKVEQDPKEANLGLEVSLTVLDLVMAFMVDQQKELNSEGSAYANEVLPVLVMLLRMNQSEAFLLHMFRALRLIVNVFAKMLFLHGSHAHITNCGELTYEILRHCDFNSSAVRSHASAILYLMIRRNFQEKGNFSRMKLQITIATERMVKANVGKEDTHLKRALEAIANFASKDFIKDSRFAPEVRQLVDRLSTALRNHFRIAKYSYDPETTAELYLETSEGYTDSPDLRVIWLHNLSVFHQEKRNHEEAAQCKIHIAALVCGYLALLKSPEAIPVDKSAFRRAAPNIGGELNLPQLDTEEGICTIKQFTRRGLFEELFLAVDMLKEGELYETCIEIYHVLTSIHQKNHDYGKLVECFDDLHKLCDKIVLANEGKSRLFSKYYRVGFYGKAFEHLDGNEFIYKEHASIRLGDIAGRLKEQFASKFGLDKVEVLPNKPVDRSALDPEKLYIQVIETAEYLDKEESKERTTPFERIFNLKRFVFETPFVLEGKKMGDNMEDLHKRKTVLTTETPFPSMKKRIRVVKKEEFVLSPIENSIDLIKGRITALQHELSSKAPNTKTLQIVLQGSVLLQVNAGPLAICEIFLGNASRYPEEKVAKLRRVMRKFVKTCGQALALNNSLITADQIPFQEKLQEGYEDAKRKISAFGVDLSDL